MSRIFEEVKNEGIRIGEIRGKEIGRTIGIIVPVGYGEEVSATVVSVGKYIKSSAPYPIEKMKTVRRKGRAGLDISRQR